MFGYDHPDGQEMNYADVTIEITDHAYARMKERLGWNKKAGCRMAQKAYTDGITHGETRGSLHRYLDSVYFSHFNATQMRIYGETLFIFNGSKLLTVYALPTKYRRKKRS